MSHLPQFKKVLQEILEAEGDVFVDLNTAALAASNLIVANELFHLRSSVDRIRTGLDKDMKAVAAGVEGQKVATNRVSSELQRVACRVSQALSAVASERKAAQDLLEVKRDRLRVEEEKLKARAAEPPPKKEPPFPRQS